MKDCKDTGWSSSTPNTGHTVTQLFTTEAGIGCWWNKVLLAASSGISQSRFHHKKPKSKVFYRISGQHTAPHMAWGEFQYKKREMDIFSLIF